MPEYRTEIKVSFIRYLEADSEVQAIDQAIGTVLRATDNIPKEVQVDVKSSTVDEV